MTTQSESGSKHTIHPEARVLVVEEEHSLVPNRDLPGGAVKNSDPVANELLVNDWTEAVKFGGQGFHPVFDLVSMRVAFANRGYQVAVSGDSNDTVFNKTLNPVVEGYEWFRGYRFWQPGKEAEVFIFSGWEQPWYPGGAPDPIIYTRGNPSEDAVRTVAATYHEVQAAFRPHAI